MPKLSNTRFNADTALQMQFRRMLAGRPHIGAHIGYKMKKHRLVKPTFSLYGGVLCRQ